MSEICSKLTIATQNTTHGSGVSIVDFEQIKPGWKPSTFYKVGKKNNNRNKSTTSIQISYI